MKKNAVKMSVVLQPDTMTDPACPICQVEIGTKSPDGVRETWALTPCGHAFGSMCLKRYLAMTVKPLCPICRQGVSHRCSHPVLPIIYDPRAPVNNKGLDAGTPPPADGTVAITDPRQTKCLYCVKKASKLSRFRRRSARSNTTSGSDDTGMDDGEASKRERLAEMARGILALALHLTRIRRRRVSHGHPDDSDDDEDYLENPMPPSPAGHGHPPIPGHYGRWDLASKGPDFKWLAWFDAQNPKTKTTVEQLR